MSFRIAEKLALQSPFLKHRVGAVITKGNRVLSSGYNSIGYSRRTGRPTRHAEASAIIKLLQTHRMADLAGSDIYVTRFTRAGHVSCARPCPHCENLIRSVGISRIFYTDFDGSTKTIKL